MQPACQLKKLAKKKEFLSMSILPAGGDRKVFRHKLPISTWR